MRRGAIDDFAPVAGMRWLARTPHTACVRKVAGGAPQSVMEIDPTDAWRLLSEDPRTLLIDVRTRAEWTFVGVPDLTALGREAALIEWRRLDGSIDPAFAARVAALANDETDRPLLFLCRSGGRSRAAAGELADAGYARCYNIAGGFEGDLDARRQRGQVNGWKAAGLPWAQS
jgi:rhodanese-related sulfurtransferase